MNLNKIILNFVSISFSILILLLVAIGLVELGHFCYEFGYRVFTEEPVASAPGTDVTVQVTSDMSEREIGEMLEEEGLVRDDLLFYAQLKLSAYSKKLQPGVYTLNTSMTGKDMMAIMAAVPEEESDGESGGENADSGDDGEAGDPDDGIDGAAGDLDDGVGGEAGDPDDDGIDGAAGDPDDDGGDDDQGDET